MENTFGKLGVVSSRSPHEKQDGASWLAHSGVSTCSLLLAMKLRNELLLSTGSERLNRTRYSSFRACAVVLAILLGKDAFPFQVMLVIL